MSDFGDNPDPTTSGGEIVEGIVYLLLTGLAIALNIYHITRYRSDLWGRREGIKFLVKADALNLTSNYKLMEHVKMCGIIGFTLSLIVGCISHNFVGGSLPEVRGSCIALTQFAMIFWQIGEACLHLTYIIAIYTNFHAFPGSVPYSINYILFFAMLVIAINSINGTGLVVAVSDSTDIRADIDGKYPFHCFAHVSDVKWRLIFGFGMMIYELSFAVGIVGAFQRACNALETGDYNVDNKALTLAKYNGQKYKSIATFTASFTFIWILIALFGAPQSVVTPLYCLDMFISIISLWLLAPYSENDKYYRKLCIFCQPCYGKPVYDTDQDDASSSPADAGKSDVQLGTTKEEKE